MTGLEQAEVMLTDVLELSGLRGQARQHVEDVRMLIRAARAEFADRGKILELLGELALLDLQRPAILALECIVASRRREIAEREPKRPVDASVEDLLQRIEQGDLRHGHAPHCIACREQRQDVATIRGLLERAGATVDQPGGQG